MNYLGTFLVMYVVLGTLMAIVGMWEYYQIWPLNDYPTCVFHVSQQYPTKCNFKN